MDYTESVTKSPKFFKKKIRRFRLLKKTKTHNNTAEENKRSRKRNVTETVTEGRILTNVFRQLNMINLTEGKKGSTVGKSNIAGKGSQINEGENKATRGIN